MSTPTITYRPGFLARLFSKARWTLTLDPTSPGNALLFASEPIRLPCLDIVSISVGKGRFGHTAEVRSRDRTDKLAGLSRRAAARLAADLKGFVNDHLAELIETNARQLKTIDAHLQSLVLERPQYLAYSDLSTIVARVPGKAASALSHPLIDREQLSSVLRAALPTSFKMLTDPRFRQHHNEAFVRAELLAFQPFFDNIGGRSLSDQQREACVRLEDNNLLVASAGSGKSATMVGKVAYVLQKEIRRPNEILVLAFNKSAADELKHRIAKQLGVEAADLECRVTTFHALGRSIIEEVQGRPPQLANWVEHPAGEAKAIEGIIANLTRNNPQFMRLWVDLLVLHPKADIPRDTFDSEIDYQRYIAERRTKGSATIGSLGGVYVKSLQEQSIANWLWLNGVEFEYERQVEITGADGVVRHVHPDFYYPITKTAHEHFALNADGTSPFIDYVEHAASKRLGYVGAEIDFFETTSAQASNGSILTALEAELVQRQIPLARRSLAEVTGALQPILIKHYHQLIGTCIKHIRSNHLTLHTLLERATTLRDKERAKVFARVVHMIAAAYSQKLADDGRIDFDSMIADATRLVQTGQYSSPCSLILVDEFQDISEPRANLIKALREQQSAKIFAVGDDWQSIYQFAGSDVSLFTRFEANFGVSWTGKLETTYRCNQLIADTAAKFVQRNPEQLKKSVRSVRPAIPKSIRVVPVQAKQGRHDFGGACLQVLARLDAFLGGNSGQWRSVAGEKLRVLVLWRYNSLDPFEGQIPKFEHIEVSAMSFHRSKGLEADYTVLMDVSEGDYGVPSRIEDDELLNLVIPQPGVFPYAEERRLFYVALTRASRGVFMLTNSGQPSRYIRELCEVAGSDIRFETADGQPTDQCPVCQVGQVVQRRSKAGRSFLGCNQYPDCRHSRTA